MTGRDLEQPALVDPVLSREFGQDDIQRSLPDSVMLWFCDSVLSLCPRRVFLSERDTTRGGEGCEVLKHCTRSIRN